MRETETKFGQTNRQTDLLTMYVCMCVRVCLCVCLMAITPGR